MQQYGMDVPKAFVKTNDITSIRCPKCAIVQDIAVGKFRNVKHTLKIRCKCGHVFTIALDFRKHYRKATCLNGSYTLTGPPNNGEGKMNIHNISRSGVEFSISRLHNIHVGQRASLNFTLDNKKETKIIIDVIVRSIRDNIIGCEFLDQLDIGKDLGFYLHP